ncbi:hypothetical protein RYH80_01875 [Halobaculum sp. MBLA0147]|uniref:DUF7097 family protein n=1 Tax=Halobaculum sp. MBLA0147 TaxID=3079934 RepID=UPI003525650B
MEETPEGTPVGVDDPYDHAGRCDHLTGDGRCRYALDHAGADREFARERRAADYACVAAADDADFRDCPHYRSTTDGKECARCGLPEVRMAHDDSRPLIEEHHLQYGSSGSDGGGNGEPETAGSGLDLGGFSSGVLPDEVTSGGQGGGAAGATESSDGSVPSDDETPAHEITVALCRWCHAKVHDGWARVDDDVEPDAEAIAERESRRSTELEEAAFSTAAERYDASGGDES